MDAYWPEFLTLTIMQILAVISPGPDFAIVFKNSFFHSRRAGILTALGITIGSFFHIGYILLGVGILIAHSVWLLSTVKLLGSGYLIYIGYKSLCAKRRPVCQPEAQKTISLLNDVHAFRQGLLTNILNPKVMLFFLSIFSIIVSPHTPPKILGIYIIMILVSTLVWFSTVAVCFSHSKIRQLFARFSHWFERIMGGFLMGLGLKLALMIAY